METKLINRTLALALIFFILSLVCVDTTYARDPTQGGKVHSYVPEHGFVPNETTAVEITQAILVPIYGNAAIEKQKPFVVTLSRNVWTIEGASPKDGVGGVFLLKLARRDARVLRLTHSK